MKKSVQKVSTAAADLAQATARLSLEQNDECSTSPVPLPVESIADLKVEMNAKVDTIALKVDSLKDELVAANKNLLVNGKLDNLAWAIQNRDLNCFAYGRPGLSRSYNYDSKELVKKILFAFRMSETYVLPEDAFYSPPNHNRDDYTELSRKHFREQVSEQIHALTGAKPRIKFNDSIGKYEIFYS